MRKIFLSFFISLSFSSFAQKVDIDKLNARFFHVAFPKTLLDSAMTFSGEFLYSRDVMTTKQVGFPKNFNLEGYRNVDANGDILIKVKFLKFGTLSEDIENKTVSKNDKGVEETKIGYNIKLTANAIYDVEVTYKGNIIHEQKNITKTLVSKVYPSDRIEKQKFNFMTSKEGATYEKNQLANILQELMTELGANLTTEIGYKRDFVSYDLFYLNPKKHPEGEQYQSIVKKLKEVIVASNNKKPLTKQDIQEGVDYLKSLIDKYNTDSKDDKSIKSSAYTDLAVIHYMIFDLENARKYQLASYELGFQPIVLQKVKDALNRMDNPNFKAAGFTSHQFDRNTELLIVDKEMAIVAAKKQEETNQQLLEYKKEQIIEAERRGVFESSFKDMANGVIEKYFVAVGGFENFKQIKNIKYAESLKLKNIPISMNSEYAIADTSFFYEKVGKLMLSSRKIYDGIKLEYKEYNSSEEFTNEEKKMKDNRVYSPAKIVEKTSIWNIILPFDFKYGFKYVSDTSFNGQDYSILKKDGLLNISFILNKENEFEAVEKVYFFNKKTNLCDGSDEIGVDGNVINSHRYTDYEEIGSSGFKMPTKAETTFGQKIIEGVNKLSFINKVSKIKVNFKLDKQEYYDYFKSNVKSESFEMK